MHDHHIPVLLPVVSHAFSPHQTAALGKLNRKSSCGCFFFRLASPVPAVQTPVLPKPFPVVGQSPHIDFHSRTHDAREYEGYFHPSAEPNSGYGHENRNAHLRFP